MQQRLIDDTHKGINIAILQTLIQPVVLTPHFEIWSCHWSVIEYNQVLFHYMYINVNIYNSLAFGNLLSNYITNVIRVQKRRESFDKEVKQKVKALSVVDTEG